jgi:hypothetical protein
MMEPERTPGVRKPSKEPAASALTNTPRVDGPGADRFGIQGHPSNPAPARASPEEPEDWGLGLIGLIARPGWEYERATALLRIGATMPQIEQHLVAKGLSPEAAAVVAERVLEDRVRLQADPLRRAKQWALIHVLLSLAAAFAVIGFALWFFGGRVALRIALAMPVYLSFIWFPEWLDWLDWPTNRFDRRTPTGMIRWAGWLLLFAVAFPMLVVGLSLSRR